MQRRGLWVHDIRVSKFAVPMPARIPLIQDSENSFFELDSAWTDEQGFKTDK